MGKGDAAPSAIERCVGDADAFAREVWGREMRHFPGADPACFDDVLSLDGVDTLVGTGGLRHPAFRLVQDGETLPRSKFQTARTTGGKRISDAMDAVAVIDAFGEGATLVLQGLHRYVRSVQRFCDQLEEFFGHPIQANAYLTPESARGLAVHHDTHDVLVLQLFGSKRWHFYDAPVEHAVPGYPKSKRHRDPGPERHTLQMRPGDCLYLPRGVPHQAEGLEGASLHLTLGIRSPTWLDVLERIMKRAREVPALRASLPLDYSTHPGSFEAALGEVLEQTADWLRDLDPVELAAGEIERAKDRRRIDQVGRLAALARADLGDGESDRDEPDRER